MRSFATAQDDVIEIPIQVLMPSKRRKILLVILGIAVVLLLNKAGGSFIKNAFYIGFSPMQKALYRAGEGTKNLFDGLSTARSLKKANQELVKQNILLKETLTLLKSYKKEAQELKQALQLAEEQGFQFVLADVVLYLPEEGVLIAAGGAHGVDEGMPVITEQGVLVGKVTEALEHFSSVILISSESSAFDVEIFSTSSEGVLAAAEGMGCRKLHFGLVPQESEISRGDIVKTTALGGKFPGGLLVGEVIQVRKNAAESFQEGEIMPYFTSAPLRELFVITNFNTPYQDE